MLSGMAWLNYHHLLYFWMVAREGSIARACALLHLTQPTISGQLRSLDKALGVKLFKRAGRSLVLTDIGRIVFRYADEIFSLGRELQDTLKGRPPSKPLRLLAGVANTLPKEIAYRLLEPALRLQEPVQLVCDHGTPDNLLAQLAVNALDVVLADAPVNPSTKIRAFNHLLGECSVSIMGTPKLAASYRRGFPQSLEGAPFLLPAENTSLRRSLEQWFATLLKVFAQHGAGVFAVRTAVEADTQHHYKVRLLGRVESIRERFYAISLERKLKHPAVVAITEAAREKLFA
jgi:LysR family transcriptional regulator, transcriptional activator of nhaA